MWTLRIRQGELSICPLVAKEANNGDAPPPLLGGGAIKCRYTDAMLCYAMLCYTILSTMLWLTPLGAVAVRIAVPVKFLIVTVPVTGSTVT